MDKYYKEKKDLQEGVKCYWEVGYVGLTEFEVISTTEEDFTMESTDRYNMRFDFTQETLDKLNERGKHLFFDRNSAFDFMYERDEARKNKVVDKYKGNLGNNLDKKIELMLEGLRFNTRIRQLMMDR